MTFWILLICLLLVIAVGVLVYRQDNQAFSQLTGYSLFDIFFRPKANYFNTIMKQLEGVEGEHKVLIDLNIPVNNSTKYIDAMVIHESGIYVMTGVQKKGWITGDENHSEWVERLHKIQLVFDNPIVKNKQLIDALQDILPEVNKDVFSSVLLFSDACSIQKIESYSQDVEVLKLHELKKWSKQIGGETLTLDEINRIYQALEQYMSFKAPVKQSLTKPVAN